MPTVTFSAKVGAKTIRRRELLRRPDIGVHDEPTRSRHLDAARPR